MKVLGIIAEYNPMHTGHIYHIQKAKELTNSDYVIVIMSGSFTQQGNIAITDKFTRAKEAIKNGADLVIELPTIFSVSDAGSFANKAIQLLNGLNIIDSICFGAENDNISLFNNICDILINNDVEIWSKIKEELKQGLSFATARNNVLKNYLSYEELEIISSPNNILGIEYIKSLKTTNSNILPYAILRQNNNFNNENICGSYTSSTSIRKSLENNENIKLLKEYLTKDTYNILTNSNLLFNNDFFDLLKYKIISMSIEEIKEINGVTEGFENKIKKEIIDCYNYDSYLFNLKSKRYELSRIKRIIVNILLNITKDDFINLKNNNANFAHILALNHEKKELLSHLSKNSNIPIITNTSDKNTNNLSTTQKKLLEFDIYSSNLHSILSKSKLNKDYTNLI